MSQQDLVNWFRQSAPYINAHRKKTIVVHISSELHHSSKLNKTLQDIALVHSLGARIVLLFGVRTSIDEACQQRKIPPYFHRGLRITTPDVIEIMMEMVGKMRAKVESAMSMGLPNSPMHHANINVLTGNFISAQPLGVVDGVDYQLTGRVRRVQTETINPLLEQRSLILIPPTGYSFTGEMFNLESEELAQVVATKLGADKIVYIGLDNIDSLPSELTPSQARSLSTPDIPLSSILSACANASDSGVKRAHYLDANIDGVILSELYTRDGKGLMITAGLYHKLRRANLNDIGGILNLIKPLEDRGALVQRSQARIETEIDYFTVIERDGMVVACCALYPFPNADTAELACVATHPSYQGMGAAKQLLISAEREAQSLGFSQIFVLTTVTSHWFVEQGFLNTDLSKLPKEKQIGYNAQRNSKLLVKPLFI